MNLISFFFLGLLWLGFRKFSLKNSDKNKTEKEYVSKLEFQNSNHCLVSSLSNVVSRATRLHVTQSRNDGDWGHEWELHLVFSSEAQINENV